MLDLYHLNNTLPAIGFPASNFRLEKLLELWRTTKNGRAFPCRTDFPLAILKPWLGNIGLVEVEHAPTRFRVRLVGEMLVEYHGQDSTGKYIQDCVPPDYLDTTLKPYLEVLASRSPVFSPTIYIQPGTMRSLMQRLYLPCSSDGRTINMLIVAVYAAREVGAF